MIANFEAIRRDGKVIPEGLTGAQMIADGWEPCKVLRLQWESSGQAVELTSPYGFLSRIVASREYLAVLEDTDATGYYAKLSVYLPDGSLWNNLPNLVDFPATEKWPAHQEPGDYLWFEPPQSSLPTAFAAVFRVLRNGATYKVDIDAATSAVLSAQEVR